MELITSGNKTVDSMGTMNISGNVIPPIWYKTITRPNGKPHLLAITLLSDIVYWYRPSEIREEGTGQVIGWQKRFKGDLLQKTYQQYADMFGESKRSVKSALDLLVELGVIKRIFRDIPCDNGMVFYNLMYLELNVEILFSLTYPGQGLEQKDMQAEKPEQESKYFDENKEEAMMGQGGTKESSGYQQNIAGGGTKLCRGYGGNIPEISQYLTRGGTLKGSILLQKNVPPPTKDDGTNTKNTTKNTTESITEITTENHQMDYDIYPIYQGNSVLSPKKTPDRIPNKMDTMEEIEAYRQLIKQNIDYDSLKTEFGYQTGLLEEILELIVETVSVERKNLRIGGTDLPYQLVKGKFCKLSREHICYVLDCMQKNTTKIGNIRSYLLTALYNAPNTMNSYYQSEVNHDMYGLGG